MSWKRRGWSIVSLLALILALAAGLIASQDDATAQPAAEEFAISDGWNIVGWTGSAAIEAGELIEAVHAPVSRIFAFDTSDGAASFDSTLPAAVNSLETVTSGAGIWLFSDGGGTYSAPTPALPATLELAAGFNLVTWLGSSGTPIAQAVASLGDALSATFIWDASAQDFERYTPSAPAALNSSRTLSRGEGLWLLVDRQVGWELEPVLTAGCADPDPSAHEIVSVPRGPEGPDNDSVFQSLEVDPSNPDIVFLGTERNGFVRSRDGGETWTRHREGVRHAGDLYPEVWDIAISPADPNLILAATLDSPGPPVGDFPSAVAGIYRSTDGGDTWTQIVGGLPTSRITAVEFHPTDPQIAVLGAEGGIPSFSGLTTFFPGGLFRSQDGGLHWAEAAADPGAVENGYRILVTRGGSTPTFYTFGVDASGGGAGLGFLASSDNGASWAPFISGLASERSPGGFDISTDGQTIVAVSGGRFAHLISLDAGLSWSETAINQANGPVAISPADSRLIIFGSQERLHRSVNGLATSTLVATAPQPPGHPRAAPFQQIAFAPSDPTVVYAATEGCLLFKSVDSGATWAQVANLRQDVLNAVP